MKINELRRNPEQNPKLDLVANLDRLLKTGKRYYVQFSNIPKLGIFPQSSYDTPLGIYAYPLPEMADAIRNNNIPFAGDRKYAVVFEANGDIVFGNQYTDADLQNDIKRVKELFKPLFRPMYKNYVEEQILIFLVGMTGTKTDYVHYLEKYGTFFVDDENEQKTNNTILKNRIKKHKEIINNPDAEDYEKRRAKRKLNELKMTYDEFVNIMINDWIDRSKSDEPITKFWNITRNIAIIQHTKNVYYTDKPKSRTLVVWNAVLRKFGYDGFVDPEGYGFIHENEPVSSVFLTKSAIGKHYVFNNTRAIEDERTLVTYKNLNDFKKNPRLARLFYYQLEDLLRTGVSKNFELDSTLDKQNLIMSMYVILKRIDDDDDKVNIDKYAMKQMKNLNRLIGLGAKYVGDKMLSEWIGLLMNNGNSDRSKAILNILLKFYTLEQIMSIANMMGFRYPELINNLLSR